MGLQEYIILKKDRSIWESIQVFLSELIATFLFVMVGCASCVLKMWGFYADNHIVQLAFAFGFAILIGVQFGAHVSGGHINPVVTLTAFILGKTALLDLLIYVIAQFSGSLLGYLVVWAVTESRFIHEPGMKVGACSPAVNKNIEQWQGLLVETIAGFILATVTCGVFDSRCRSYVGTISLKFAFVVVAEVLAFGHFTGCNMNPARSFGPAAINGDLSEVWIYMVGPLVGCAAAALLYRVAWALPYSEEMGNKNE